MANADDAAAISQIGRYQILGEVGRGAMGLVYHAIDPTIGRPVAIKTIRIRDINDTQQRERLRERLFREARSAGVLSHPNIVTIYDMDEVDGLAYIAMAWVNGPGLDRILASEEPLSGSRMLRILRQAAFALDYAHSKDIIHRDVKPANIMTDEDGSVKVTDFGIAKIGTAAANETQTVAGTPNYMSPEQVQAQPVDGRSDQFSLAVIAYEILTGERPFTGESISAIVYGIVHEEPPSAHQINSTLTPQIDTVLRKALAKKPEDRYPSCANFVGALEFACAESRGWKTLAAGSAGTLPTMVIDQPRRPAAPAPPPSTEFPATAAARSEHQTSKVGPFLISVLVVAGVAAIFLYQSGLIGSSAPDTPNAPVQQTETTRAAAPPPTDTKPKPEPAPAPATDEPATPPPTVAEKSPEPAHDIAVAPPPRAESPKPSPLVPPSTALLPRVNGPRTQDVWISTDPGGSNIVLDDNPGYSCLTPCMLHAAGGTHHISIAHAGYLSDYRQFTVGDQPIELETIKLREPTGTLLLATSPAGASIRIDGKLRPESTPATLALKPGNYSVTVEKNGQSRTEKIEMKESPYYLKIPLGQ